MLQHLINIQLWTVIQIFFSRDYGPISKALSKLTTNLATSVALWTAMLFGVISVRSKIATWIIQGKKNWSSKETSIWHKITKARSISPHKTWLYIITLACRCTTFKHNNDWNLKMNINKKSTGQQEPKEVQCVCMFLAMWTGRPIWVWVNEFVSDEWGMLFVKQKLPLHVVQGQKLSKKLGILPKY